MSRLLLINAPDKVGPDRQERIPEPSTSRFGIRNSGFGILPLLTSVLFGPGRRKRLPKAVPFPFGIRNSGFGIPLLLIFLLLSTLNLCLLGQSSRVLVVVNDSSPESIRVGKSYAERRTIPDENLCRIRTEVRPAVSRRIFESEIRDPIAQCLAGRSLQDRILYIVTTLGVPLWVEGQSGPVGDLASVDSELAALYQWMAGERMVNFGRLTNPYFSPPADSKSRRTFRREDYPGYLVTRLSGATVDDALALVERGTVATSSGTVAIDLPGQRNTLVRSWLTAAVEAVKEAGCPVELEETAEPFRSATRLLGLVVDQDGQEVSDKGWNWAPGALGVVLGRGKEDSLGDTGRPPDMGTSSGAESPVSEFGSSAASIPALKLVASGVTGSIHFIGDPTEDGFPRPQLLFPAYLAGNNLAESFYQSLRYLSWRQVVLGDPLARVAPGVPEEAWKDEVDSSTDLPLYFSRRKMENLRRRLPTGSEALVLLLRAEAAAAKGDEGSAIDLLEQSINLDSAVGESQLLRAELYERQGRWEDAFTGYSAALRLKAGDEETLRRKLAAIALDRLKDYAKAEEQVRVLFARNGFSDLDIAGMWARIKLEAGELDQAEGVYLRILKEQDPPPALALKGLGDVYTAKGDAETARRFYQRASPEQTAETASKPESPTAPEAPALESSLPEAPPESTPARVLERIEPERSKSGVKPGRGSKVELRLLIDEQGQLIKVEPVSGDKSLVKAAVEAVRKWTFAPKLVNGRPEVDQILVVIDFSK